jgi:type I restriction enzyme S subunit
MKPGWKTAALGDVCTLIARGVAPKYVEEGGTLVLNQKCVRDHAINYTQGRRHDAAAKRIASDRFIKAGDVLINSTGTGTLGRVAQVRNDPLEPTTVDTHVTIARPIPEEFYCDFFGYALVLLEDQLATSGEGASGQTELARTTVSKFKISYPIDPEEQRRIVAVLDAAFAGIATATANAEKNLANAQELFENSLGAAFAALVSTTPEQSIGEIAAIKGGKRVPKGYRLLSDPTPYPYLTVGDFTEHGTIDPSGVRYVSEDIHNQIKRYIIRTEDLYVSIAGTIGRTGIVPPEFDGAQLTENACRLIFNEGISNRFVYFFTKSAAFRRQAIEQTRTAAQPKLALSRLEKIRLPVPDLDVQKAMMDNFSQLQDYAAQLADQALKKLELLAALKQSLLQGAFSGELTATVPESIAA